ncbi:MAG: peptidyl-prolyl cis-trans isomerase PpiA precursor [Segetibacter sp.]|jgi:peptidyl-prolyl cis-trans isomerase A (cyclophilin A)|nr:peptidyl-prolyl cis-trans isomerase PpiA precursor [Segetibacter sp.]
MWIRNLAIVFCLILFSCSQKKYKNPHVLIQTRPGSIEVELYADKAPKSVAAFLAIVDSGLYKNATFYRVLNQDNQPSDAFKATLIQGGLWRTKRQVATALPRIPHETTEQTGILHEDGVISLARVEPGSATSEFFICLGDQPGFDYGGENNPDKQGYAAFGKVVKGMDIVKLIYNRPEDDQYFERPIFIFDIIRL